jgi:predicted transcriptional regulator
MKKTNQNKLDNKEDLLEDIRALLVLLLKSNKVEGGEIAKAMGMSEGSVSKLLDKSKYGAKK